MEDFEDRVRRLRKEKQDAQRQIETQQKAAELAAAQKKYNEEQEKKRQLNEFLEKIRNSPAYKQAKAEAYSAKLHDALEYVHFSVKPEGPKKVAEAEGWIFIKTVYKTVIGRIPFQVTVDEVVEPHQYIGFLVKMSIGHETINARLSDGQSLMHKNDLNFQFTVTNDLVLHRSSQLYITCQGYDTDGMSWSSQCGHLLPFTDLNEILEHLAEIASNYSGW